MRMFTMAAVFAALLTPLIQAAEDPVAKIVEEQKSAKSVRKTGPSGLAGRPKTTLQTGRHPRDLGCQEGDQHPVSAPLGSQTYGNTVVANGKVYVGTNNYNGYLKRYPKTVDLGVLLCFDEKTGKFLWQHSSQKLPTGLVHDWPDMGICCSPYCDGDRLWYVTSRGEVVCLDSEGFLDNENDSPFTSEENENKDEADVVWKFDMMGQLGTSQHNMCSCSIGCIDNVLFVCSSNGVDESHVNIPARRRPASSPWTATRARFCGPTRPPARTFCTVSGLHRPTPFWVVRLR